MDNKRKKGKFEEFELCKMCCEGKQALVYIYFKKNRYIQLMLMELASNTEMSETKPIRCLNPTVPRVLRRGTKSF